MQDIGNALEMRGHQIKIIIYIYVYIYACVYT